MYCGPLNTIYFYYSYICYNSIPHIHLLVLFPIARARTLFVQFDSSSTSAARRTGTQARMLQSLPPLYSSYIEKNKDTTVVLLFSNCKKTENS